MVKIQCDGKTANDCFQCGKYFSAHSLHYCRIEEKKVSDIKCSIGGNRTFNEDGQMIRGE